MNFITKIVAAVTLFAALSGCAEFLGDPVSAELSSGSTQKASYSAASFPAIDNWLVSHNLAITAGQGFNDYNRSFAQGAVIVYGEGVATTASNQAQKRLNAERAAEVVAQRNLVEYFADKARNGELRFTSYTTKLEGFIKGAANVASEYDPATGRAAVLLKLDLKGARAFAP